MATTDPEKFLPSENDVRRVAAALERLADVAEYGALKEMRVQQTQLEQLRVQQIKRLRERIIVGGGGYRTKTGRVLTDDEIERFAAEAEADSND